MMCVQILRLFANDRGWFQHRNGAAVMVNHGDGDGDGRRAERERRREMCV